VRPDLLTHPSVARLREALTGVEGAWLVGGAVRDLLLGRDVVDLDVVVEGDGVAAARSAARATGGTVREHGRFGTAAVAAADGFAFDVVTARAESYPAPGALPEVRAGTLEEDLARRDFTVNALALALRDGVLREHPGALADLEAGWLRVLHAASFRDDPTRLLRLVRYAARLGFEPEPRTDSLARDAIGAGALDRVSGARIGAELRLLCGEPSAEAALTRAHALGLDAALHPDFEPRLDLARRAEEHLGEGRRDLLRLACCATRFEAGELRRWLDGLELTAGERETVLAAALEAPLLAERLAHAHRPSQVRHLVADRPAEALAVAAALGADEVVDRWLVEWRHAELAITGDDVVAAGVPEGPQIGRALDAAWAAALDEGVTGREGQLAAALRAARGE
jgi:tRNA nucleotidyltransferase (CCA-adding enzyme)